MQCIGDGWWQLDVHLGNPQRQDIGRMGTPLHAGPHAQLLQGEFLEWVRRHSRRLSRGQLSAAANPHGVCGPTGLLPAFERRHEAALWLKGAQSENL
jgi:hypothetical protein